MASFLTFEVESDLLKGFDTVLTGNHGQFAHATAKSAANNNTKEAIQAYIDALKEDGIASLVLLRASSLVLPWLMHPGRLGTSATQQPSSPG